MAPPRFLTLADVADLLNVSAAQAYALVRSGDLPAVKIGGRGQWRVEQGRLEDYIARLYDETASFIAEHPYGRGDVAVDLSDSASAGNDSADAGHRGLHSDPPRTHSTAV